MIRFLARLVVFLRDMNAVRRGRIGQRIYNKAVGRLAARGLRKVWR